MGYAPYWWYDDLRFRFVFGVYPIIDAWIREREVYNKAIDTPLHRYLRGLNK